MEQSTNILTPPPPKKNDILYKKPRIVSFYDVEPKTLYRSNVSYNEIGGFFVVLLNEITFFNPESNLRNLKCVQIDMGSDFFWVLFIPSVALYTIFQAYQG